MSALISRTKGRPCLPANQALRDGLVFALRYRGAMCTAEAGRAATGRYEPAAYRHLAALEAQGVVTRVGWGCGCLWVHVVWAAVPRHSVDLDWAALAGDPA